MSKGLIHIKEIGIYEGVILKSLFKGMAKR